MSMRWLLIGILAGGATSLIAWSPLIPDPLVFHSVSLAAIGAIYLGFALSDGRLSIMILESAVATAFVVIALMGVWFAPLSIAVGLVLHGLWDLAHRPGLIGTRLPAWYPPFCAAFDFVFAGVFLLLARELATRPA